MFRFVLSFVLVFLAFSGSAAAQSSQCAALKPFETKIDINYIIAEPVYDHSQSRKQLQKGADQQQAEWLKKNNMQMLWKVEDMERMGLASGSWAKMWNFTIIPRKVDQFGTHWCLFFGEVNLEIFYRTIIQIANDFPQGSCSFNEIHDHELRHHITNGLAVEKYLLRLREDMQRMVTQMENYGYVRYQDAEKRSAELEQGIKDAFDIYTAEYIEAEMSHNNALIDSPEEYEKTSRVLAECAQANAKNNPQSTKKTFWRR